MIHFRSALIGLGTVLLGFVVALIAILIWMGRKTGPEEMSIGFSPIDAAHSMGFWAFVVGLFAAGFVTSLFFQRK